MEYSTLKSTILRVIDSLAARTPHTGWQGARQLAECGELEEAMDVLVAILVRGGVPVTATEQNTVRDLMDEFDFDADDKLLYAYLSDAEMLDRMTVVDEPAP